MTHTLMFVFTECVSYELLQNCHDIIVNKAVFENARLFYSRLAP